MSVKQISVFIENKKGKLAEASKYLADHNVNLRALSIADTSEFGILRIICDDMELAQKVLKEGDYVITITDVLAVRISDKAGSLSEILEVLSEANVVIEYTYAFLSKKPDSAYIILRVDDNQRAAAALASAGIKTANQDELF